MTSRKRPAPEPILPRHAKQPRRALLAMNGEPASPSEAEGLLSRWSSFTSDFYVLAKDTFFHFVQGRSESHVQAHPAANPVPSHIPPVVRKSLAPKPQPRRESGRPHPPISDNLPARSRASPHDIPSRFNKKVRRPAMSPTSTFNDALPERSKQGRLSRDGDNLGSNAPTDTSFGSTALPPSSSLEVIGSTSLAHLEAPDSSRAQSHPQLDAVIAASTRRRRTEEYPNGIPRNYQNREHIFAKAHKANVQAEKQRSHDEMIEELYRLQREKGYSADYHTFKGYLHYRHRIDVLANRDSLLSSPSLIDLPSTQSALPETTKPRRNSLPNDHTTFLERALRTARATLDGPAPTRPFMAAFEHLRIVLRNKDQDIERRLRGPKPLPSNLPPEDEARVDALLQKQNLVCKFAKEQVSGQDLSRLRPAQWLNDEIINFYGAMIMARSEAAKENNKLLNVHYFSTFFWTKLSKEGYEKGRLAKWTKKVDLFSKDVILIPVNHSNAHWTSAAINFRRKRIESYDSMGYCREDVFRVLRMYLDAEHRNKRKQPFDFTGWENYFSKATPQQENGYDCGVFTCQFLESLSRGEEEFGFDQNNMPYLRRRMVWEIGNGKLRDET